ncbi:MAG: hypothetical protein LBB04_00120 [Oscillospiraceae bacterium]|nr:hypothetical protein [Oscillospiraceae bacterium]
MDDAKFLEVPARELFAINGGFPPKKDTGKSSAGAEDKKTEKQKQYFYNSTGPGQKEIMDEIIKDDPQYKLSQLNKSGKKKT